MNIKATDILGQALANVPKRFRRKLINTYLEIKRYHLEANYASAGLSAGKFCETLIRVLQQEVKGSYTPFGKSINNMADECRIIITTQNNTVVESIKTIIPRALIFLYTMRNKRGIGHIGGDINANSIDSATIARTADWILCELIRVFHKLPLEEAQDLIDGLSVKSMPIIWEVAGRKRVLNNDLPAKHKALLLLYSSSDAAVLTEDLCSWIEYAPNMFKTRVLNDLHKQRLIEHDQESDLVYISPTGAKLVEDQLL